MANYLSAIKKTLQWEGGYANLQGDTGGETYRGISRKFNPHWAGWYMLDDAKPLKHNQIIPSLEEDVVNFYKAHYWDKIHLDSVCNDKIAAFAFDTHVHSGVSGIKMLQRAIGVKDDGVVGNKTINALNQSDINTLKQARIRYLKSLSQPKFERGWIARVNSF